MEPADQLRLTGEVYVDATHRGIYATDASHYQMMPRWVAVPRDEEDVGRIVAFAGERGVPITGRGGGTSLAGQTFGRGIVVDFSKYMNAVLEVNEHERWARVQPGVVRDHLNQRLSGSKLFFAPDPATTSRATVGGMINNNSSGMRSVIYGKTIDHVIALKVMLDDGTVCWFEDCDTDRWSDQSAGGSREAELYRGVGQIIKANRDEIVRRFPKVMRRVGGYNLDEFAPGSAPGSGPGNVPPRGGTQGGARPRKELALPWLGEGMKTFGDNFRGWNLSKLICGSEGTLGLVLEAKVNLAPVPGATALCVVHFNELIESLRPVPEMLTHKPSAIELLDEIIIRESRTNPATAEYADFFEGNPTAVQIVEFMGDTQGEADDRARRFAADMQAKGIGYAHVLRHDAESIGHVWELRRLGVGLQSNVKGRKKPLDFVDDACVPVEKLAQYIERLRDVCTKLDVVMPICAHASVGVLHPKPMLDLHWEEDRKKMRVIADAAFAMVKEYGGSWAGEHGDGLVRGEYIRPFFGDQLYEAFGQVKRLFDPRNIMNPGKILDTPGMTENLRHGVAGYEQHAHEVKANYHYRDQGGFVSAVEQCNGVGACRKIGDGTMCPSYMATRDEDASTRGRANALRLAMSGQLGPSGLTDDGVAEVLELCLACKGCKTECPNAVDMAKLKSDVLQMRHDERGLPLGYRLLGNSPGAAKMIAGPLARVVNAAQKWGAYKWVMQRVAGVDARRAYPMYATKPLEWWVNRGIAKPRAAPGSSLGQVVLFDDTYMNYHEPNVGLSAMELLTACGYEVILAKAGCCQRPRLSKGMVRAAKRDGEKTLRNLLPFAERGLPILFCEPSCMSAIADDLPDLMDDATPPEVGATLAKQVKMIDVFLAEQLAAGKLDVRFEATVGEILLHGHCHQKALQGTRGMHEVFARIDGLKVTEVDGGCCGMAGSFGYEHFDLSMRIGEQRLFPAVRRATERGAAICANGFSCRHQVHDGCDAEAKHFVELVRVKPPAKCL
ncbi:MAG: FAD-linked oxidase C-terminal domain-containing protein [Phycisphaeraceae bacterium]